MTATMQNITLLPYVDWSIIRYANCWEDAEFLLQQLDLSPGKRILSIASGGDNSFSLLTTDPEQVVAVDINATQLYLVELKAVAIRNFSHAECLAFFGFTNGMDRQTMFRSIAAQLSPKAVAYFNHHSDIITKGIIHAGKLGKFFNMFAKYILPLIHGKERIEELFREKSRDEQQAYFKKAWNTKRWRSFFKIAFSRQVLGRYGRDPEFFNQVKIPVAEFILQQTQTHLQHPACQRNSFLHYVLTGNFGAELPHYMQPEYFEKVKHNLDRLQLWHGPVESAVDQFGSFDAFNLSNLFEYLPKDNCREIAQKLIQGARSEAKLAYWNLMVDRQLSTMLPGQLINIKKLNAQARPEDDGFFYNRFLLDRVSQSK